MQWQRAKEQNHLIRYTYKTQTHRVPSVQARNVPTRACHDSMLIYLDYLSKSWTQSVRVDTASTEMSLFETKTPKILDKMVNYETFSGLQPRFLILDVQF